MQTKVVRSLFYAILFFNVSAVIAQSFLLNAAQSFYDDSNFFDDHRRLIEAATYIVSALLMTVGIAIHYASHLSIRRLPFILICLVIFFLWISVFTNGLKINFFFVLYMPIALLFLFEVLDHYPIPDRKIALFTFLFLVWTVAPVVWHLVDGVGNSILTAPDGTFRGLAASRSDYGLFASFVVLLLLMGRSRWNFVFIPILLYGIVISGSRASIVALAASVTLWYLLKHDRKVQDVVVAVLIVVAAMYVIFYELVLPRSIIAYDERRWELLLVFGKFIQANLWFGAGEYVRLEMPDGSTIEAHSAFLQGVANFGVLATLAFSALIGYRVYRSDTKGRVILCFMLIFGLFHPGLDLLFINSTSTVLYCYAGALGVMLMRYSRIQASHLHARVATDVAIRRL